MKTNLPLLDFIMKRKWIQILNIGSSKMILNNLKTFPWLDISFFLV